ncbi:MAG: hypothetical protein HFH86_02915 [Bacilli bacterium]|jgi:capsular polysaccharide biosynthesis protein|nr:hypothetical protein [Bacilli bacterium]
MEDINILEFLSYIKKHLVFFALVVIFTLIICLFYFMVLRRPVYSSEVSMTLTGVSGNDSKITTNDITLNSKMLPTYQEIITSRKVLEQVIDNLKLNKTVGDLASNIKITAATDSMVLSVRVVDSNRVVARDVANEVANIFGSEIKNLYNIKNVTILDKAIASDDPDNMNYAKFLVISFMGGIFVALAGLLFVFFIDNTVKSVEQVDSKMDMIVLGAIPDYHTMSKSTKKGGKKHE